CERVVAKPTQKGSRLLYVTEEERDSARRELSYGRHPSHLFTRRSHREATPTGSRLLARNTVLVTVEAAVVAHRQPVQVVAVGEIRHRLASGGVDGVDLPHAVRVPQVHRFAAPPPWRNAFASCVDHCRASAQHYDEQQKGCAHLNPHRTHAPSSFIAFDYGL